MQRPWSGPTRCLTTLPGLLTETQGMPINAPICPGSIRHIWLMAFNELRWAEAQGRKKPRDMLKTERAAQRLCNRARAFSACSRDYNKRYSRFQQVLMAEHGSPEEAAQIEARRHDPERRRLLMEVRSKRRSAFKVLFAAIRSYQRARSSLSPTPNPIVN
jgi:hypothetical protein